MVENGGFRLAALLPAPFVAFSIHTMKIPLLSARSTTLPSRAPCNLGYPR